MITHIVVFKLVRSDEKSIEAARAALAGLRGQIPNCAIWR